jgi:hypothetical protein
MTDRSDQNKLLADAIELFTHSLTSRTLPPLTPLECQQHLAQAVREALPPDGLPVGQLYVPRLFHQEKRLAGPPADDGNPQRQCVVLPLWSNKQSCIERPGVESATDSAPPSVLLHDVVLQWAHSDLWVGARATFARVVDCAFGTVEASAKVQTKSQLAVALRPLFEVFRMTLLFGKPYSWRRQFRELRGKEAVLDHCETAREEAEAADGGDPTALTQFLRLGYVSPLFTEAREFSRGTLESLHGLSKRTPLLHPIRFDFAIDDARIDESQTRPRCTNVDVLPPDASVRETARHLLGLGKGRGLRMVDLLSIFPRELRELAEGGEELRAAFIEAITVCLYIYRDVGVIEEPSTIKFLMEFECFRTSVRLLRPVFRQLRGSDADADASDRSAALILRGELAHTIVCLDPQLTTDDAKVAAHALTETVADHYARLSRLPDPPEIPIVDFMQAALGHDEQNEHSHQKVKIGELSIRASDGPFKGGCEFTALYCATFPWARLDVPREKEPNNEGAEHVEPSTLSVNIVDIALQSLSDASVGYSLVEFNAVHGVSPIDANNADFPWWFSPLSSLQDLLIRGAQNAASDRRQGLRLGVGEPNRSSGPFFQLPTLTDVPPVLPFDDDVKGMSQPAQLLADIIAGIGYDSDGRTWRLLTEMLLMLNARSHDLVDIARTCLVHHGCLDKEAYAALPPPPDEVLVGTCGSCRVELCPVDAVTGERVAPDQLAAGNTGPVTFAAFVTFPLETDHFTGRGSEVLFGPGCAAVLWAKAPETPEYLWFTLEAELRFRQAHRGRVPEPRTDDPADVGAFAEHCRAISAWWLERRFQSEYRRVFHDVWTAFGSAPEQSIER